MGYDFDYAETEYFINRHNEDGYDDDDLNGGSSPNIACRHCDQPHLMWRKYATGWILTNEVGAKHRCATRKDVTRKNVMHLFDVLPEQP